MLLKINDVLVVTDPETGEIVRAANRKEVEGLRGIRRDEKGRIVHDEAALAARKEHFLFKRAQFVERIVACENEVRGIDPAFEFDDAGENVRLKAELQEVKRALEVSTKRAKELSDMLLKADELVGIEKTRAEQKISGLMRQLEVVTPIAEKPPKVETVVVEKIVEVTKPCDCWWCKFMGWFN